jgi:hypothetical protein
VESGERASAPGRMAAMVTGGIEVAEAREDLLALRRRVIKELVDLDVHIPGRRRSRFGRLVAMLRNAVPRRRRSRWQRLIGR